jgi:chorismate mutase
LWLGAIERLNKAGLNDVAALHRGFSVFQNGIYRNPPQWEIPIELMRLRPDILMLCDPSHICGNRELLLPIGQQALDLRMRGLMIETHPDPDHAWSDAQQQITASQLQALIVQWIIRKTHFEDAFASAQIEHLRHQIDELDDELIKILLQRKNVVEKIAQLKEQQGVQIYQLERWQELVEKANKQAKELGLNPLFLHRILSVIHNQAIDDQSKIMNVDKVKSETT